MERPQSRPSVADDLTLRAWENDESAMADLVIAMAGPIERAIAQLPGMGAIAEDIVAEAIFRFWNSRHHYDGQRPLRAYLYAIARNIASEYSSGRLCWQKSRNLESSCDGAVGATLPRRDADPRLKELEQKQSRLLGALRAVVDGLEPLQRDILECYANAGDYDVDAGELGVELGHKHNGGVPIPAGTIRVYKNRAKKKVEAEMRSRGFDLSTVGVRT